MKAIALVFLGGGMGSILRYLIGRAVIMQYQGNFPLATLMANVLSCLIMGLTLALVYRSSENALLYPLLIVGFCGGFSTFSTFSYETLLLIKSGNWFFAIINILISVLSCLLILWMLSKKIS